MRNKRDFVGITRNILSKMTKYVWEKKKERTEHQFSMFCSLLSFGKNEPILPFLYMVEEKENFYHIFDFSTNPTAPDKMKALSASQNPAVFPKILHEIRQCLS